ncbi:hypothetical protein DPMN_002104 [Dreissena polymorpha]|uniref:Uncharacterized protein n=1 Tax=Dreissena polymorpha TaxID=45954 RepID=A0A9D4RTK4_DREPO|nr:hypothetical protein DPMN_002104 [Dreissena polymorpha]
MQSHICTQRNNKRHSGQLGLDARRQFLGVRGELLGQEFGAKLKEAPTPLLRGRDYLIYKIVMQRVSQSFK